MSFSHVSSSVVTLLLLTLSGCSSTGTLPPAGESVQTLIRLQTERPSKTAVPLTSKVTLDGQQGVEVMRHFRTNVAKPVEVNNEIHVNIGN